MDSTTPNAAASAAGGGGREKGTPELNDDSHPSVKRFMREIFVRLQSLEIHGLLRNCSLTPCLPPRFSATRRNRPRAEWTNVSKDKEMDFIVAVLHRAHVLMARNPARNYRRASSTKPITGDDCELDEGDDLTMLQNLQPGKPSRCMSSILAATHPLRFANCPREEYQDGGSGKSVIRTGEYHKTLVERLESLGTHPGKKALWNAVNSFCWIPKWVLDECFYVRRRRRFHGRLAAESRPRSAVCGLSAPKRIPIPPRRFLHRNWTRFGTP